MTCNRCAFEEMLALATSMDARVELRLRGEQLPAGLEAQEQYSGPPGRGYDLFFVYREGRHAWVMWLAGLDTACACGGAANRAPFRSQAS